MKIRDGMAIVRVSSHRAMRKLRELLGREAKEYFEWESSTHWKAVTTDELEKIKKAKIKGITQSKWTGKQIECIKWDEMYSAIAADGPTEIE